MALRTTFTCTHCQFDIDSWDEGSPYLLCDDGFRFYFCHPCEHSDWRRCFERETGKQPASDEELMSFVSARACHEAHYLCLHCARQTKRDPKRDSLLCTGCKKSALKDLCELEGIPCPKCKTGTFHGEMTAIS